MTMATGLRPPVITGGDEGRAFWFLDTLVVDRTPRQGAVPTVMEMTIPGGGSPPEHVHETEDDSFYLLDGSLAVRCGDQSFVASAGAYLALPRGVPHTFRVLDDEPARLLLVHETDAFLRFVEGLGEPAEERRLPTVLPAVTLEELARGSAELAHAPVVGPSMAEDEARQIAAENRAVPGDLRSRIGGIVHLMFTVRDLRVSQPWYSNFLSLVTVTDRAAQDGSGHVALLHPPTGLVIALRTGDRDDVRFDEQRVGLDHVAFGVRDRGELQAWMEWLTERHISHSGIKDVPFGSGMTVRDPDGIPIELFAPPPARD